MSILRKAATVFAAAFLVLPAALSAQAPNTGLVKYIGDDASNGVISSAQVGPYRANLSGFGDATYHFADNSNALVWCVDWSHYAPSTSTFESYISSSLQYNNATSMSNTREYFDLGNNSAANPGALLKYKQAAWLIEQYGTSATFNATNIQGTIWKLFDSSAPAAGLWTYSSLTSYLPGTINLTRNWFVLTDSCMVNVNHGCTSNQEFMYSTTSTVPEPSTYMLMAAGLVGVGVATRRRKRAK